ncbi:antiviral reverse transcriptase Drt3a [Pseudomonas sp. Marseille-P8916]|uniref:antiviral reverse transcriptase Drt3a n=1 Tax=Pseudomonas sp. Marseille-P8916 TaxID=2866589 RepID=UPI001CE4A030|nr:antiviral reverse transcriptase Drt3a [Pseudomonas sp. Marseille-P8916]
MFDQSFNKVSVSKSLRKSDFLKHPKIRDPRIKSDTITSAIERANAGFQGHDLLASSIVKGKKVFKIKRFSDELLLRKINKNIQKNIKISAPSRDTIIANIKNLISEGVAYRVYRFDIKSFYESFDTASVAAHVSTIPKLSQATKKMVRDILDHHVATGGRGIPRGLALSATLSELMMFDFDNSIRAHNHVFFYSRYVDDMIFITSKNEDQIDFKKFISKLLPSGLKLNEKKTIVCEANQDVKPYKPTATPPDKILEFEFLGYKLSVYEPVKNSERSQLRSVLLDIAESKVKKIKTRVTRSLISYRQNLNFKLLKLRLQFLTSNFSVPDIDRERKRLAGIYYNYHRIDFEESKALGELDSFLQKAILSSHGKIFEDFFCNTTVAQRRELMKLSFSRGFKEKTFLHFSKNNLIQIQECWNYA